MFVPQASDSKFEQNRKVQTTRNFELSDKKLGCLKIFLTKSVDAILEDVSVAKTIVNY